MRVWCLVAALACAAPGCGRPQGPEVLEPGGPPPLPPASGSVIGYLVEARHDLELRDEQVTRLQRIDDSLAARNAALDTQIREIEKPVPAQELSPQQITAGERAPRYNNAPGASTIVTEESQKLRALRQQNDREAIGQAFAVLDPAQQGRARKILEDRGVTAPGSGASAPAPRADGASPLPAAEP